MSPAMKQLLETMCGGDFMRKHPEEAMEDMEMKAKLSTLARRLEELEMRNHHEVRAVTEAFMSNQPCFICQSTEHQGEHCPAVPSVRDMMAEHANVVGQYKPPTTAPYGNTYNLN